jgi:hypothetical protein
VEALFALTRVKTLKTQSLAGEVGGLDKFMNFTSRSSSGAHCEGRRKILSCFWQKGENHSENIPFSLTKACSQEKSFYQSLTNMGKDNSLRYPLPAPCRLPASPLEKRKS